jgi:hypothetical protein
VTSHEAFFAVSPSASCEVVTFPNTSKLSCEGNAKSLKNGCTISLVSTGPQLVRPQAAQERNWLPLVVAAAIVLAVLAGLILIFGRGKSGPAVTPISAPTDPYAKSLTLSGLQMSESAIMTGGTVTYLDGEITNNGSQTVTGITVQVIFRDSAHEVAWNETQPLRIIRTREPYIDVEPLAATPLKPGGAEDFRLIFDTVPQDWDGALPEIRIIHVDFK